MARHRRRRKARRNPRRRARRLNVGRVRRRGRTRRNPAKRGQAEQLLAVGAGLAPKARHKRRRFSKKTRKARARRRARNSRLLKRQKSLSRRAKGMKRGYRKSALRAQAKRLGALRQYKGTKLSKSPVYKAMHIKTNPGLAGLWVAAKALAPTVGVGAVSMIGLAMVGKKLSDLLTTTADPAVVATAAAVTPAAVVPSTTASAATAGLGAVRDSFLGDDKQPKAIVKYMPAISTVLVSAAAYWAANKWAPKYKGAVVVGGLLGAVVQALAAATSAPGASSDSLAAKAKAALGLGDYTTVGGRSYAEGGMFREVGDYTTVGALEARDGGAYSNQRPRRGEMDNATQWATSGLGAVAMTPEQMYWYMSPHQRAFYDKRHGTSHGVGDLSPSHFAARHAMVAQGGGAYSRGRPRATSDNATEWALDGLDDTTEFAPGEGGVLAGGMFRGPSTR